MKRIALIIVGALAAVVVALVAMVFAQPGAIELERSVELEAKVVDVEPFLTDLKKFNEWSPWRDVDPNLTFEYSPTTAGQGAWYTWDGNDEAGAGKQTLTEVGPGKAVSELAFTRPFEDIAHATVTWAEKGDKVAVKWAFHQEAGFMTKAANLAMDIEGMIGKDYDRGLADLSTSVSKAVADRKAAEKAAADALLAAKEAEEAPATP